MTVATVVEGRDRCGAKTRAGGQCGRPSGWGTEHVGIGACKLHGGSTPNHEKAARVVQARQLLGTLGIVEDPTTLPPVHVAAELQLSLAKHLAAVRWLEWQVGGLRPEEFPSSPWPKLLADAKRDADRLLVECGRLSIDTQVLRLEEKQGQLVVRLLERVLSRLDGLVLEQTGRRVLDPLDPSVRAIVATELQQLHPAELDEREAS